MVLTTEQVQELGKVFNSVQGVGDGEYGDIIGSTLWDEIVERVIGAYASMHFGVDLTPEQLQEVIGVLWERYNVMEME